MKILGMILLLMGVATFFFNIVIGLILFFIGLFVGLLGEHWEVMEQGGREAIKKREREKREQRRTKAHRFGQKMGNLFSPKGN